MAVPRHTTIVTMRGCCGPTCPMPEMRSCVREFSLGSSNPRCWNWPKKLNLLGIIIVDTCWIMLIHILAIKREVAIVGQTNEATNHEAQTSCKGFDPNIANTVVSVVSCCPRKCWWNKSEWLVHNFNRSSFRWIPTPWRRKTCGSGARRLKKRCQGSRAVKSWSDAAMKWNSCCYVSDLEPQIHPVSTVSQVVDYWCWWCCKPDQLWRG